MGLEGTPLPGNSEIVLSEAVLLIVIVIEVLDIGLIDYDYEHAHEHDELNWRAKPLEGVRA